MTARGGEAEQQRDAPELQAITDALIVEARSSSARTIDEIFFVPPEQVTSQGFTLAVEITDAEAREPPTQALLEVHNRKVAGKKGLGTLDVRPSDEDALRTRLSAMNQEVATALLHIPASLRKSSPAEAHILGALGLSDEAF